MTQAQQAAQHQPGSDQQQDHGGYLSGDQKLSQAAVGACGGAGPAACVAGATAAVAAGAAIASGGGGATAVSAGAAIRSSP